MPRERRGIHVIQHNTTYTTTREKPWYMPSTDVHHLNNRKDSNQATMNNMALWAWSADACGRSQTTSLPARQQPRSPARLLMPHLHSYWTMKTPIIVTLTQHVIFSISCRTGWRPVSCDLRPASVSAMRAASAIRRRQVVVANRASKDSDLTVRRGVWNHFQYSSPI